MLAAVAMLVAGGLATEPVRAQMSVVDVSAIRQLVLQISYWRQQIQAMSGQLLQLQQTHAAFTGTRGMQHLLPQLAQAHDHLPADYAALRDAVQGLRADYQALGAAARAAIAANEVLDAPRMARLGVSERQLLEQARRGSALWQVASEGAYRQSGERFAQLEQLLAAIGSAGDAKAIADLQGRIAAEQAMLANEQLQFQALAQRALAEQAVHAQRVREQTVQQHGEFGRRFEPTLP
jgi:type IV secretion system protein VirB5